MGTWSRPLFAVTTPAKPSSYILDTSALTKRQREDWRSNAFLITQNEKETDTFEEKFVWNLDEFMDTECDTHKIMDYMGAEAIRRWQSLFDLLAEQNPTLECVQFHFYCSDTGEPFMFSWKRGVEHFRMNVGSCDSIWYSTLQSDKEAEYDRGWSFDIEKYREHHAKVQYRSTEMRPRTDTILPWF
jgi:hypothetical protein